MSPNLNLEIYAEPTKNISDATYTKNKDLTPKSLNPAWISYPRKKNTEFTNTSPDLTFEKCPDPTPPPPLWKSKSNLLKTIFDPDLTTKTEYLTP